jgi:hypothetical protein
MSKSPRNSYTIALKLTHYTHYTHLEKGVGRNVDQAPKKGGENATSKRGFGTFALESVVMFVMCNVLLKTP